MQSTGFTGMSIKLAVGRQGQAGSTHTLPCNYLLVGSSFNPPTPPSFLEGSCACFPLICCLVHSILQLKNEAHCVNDMGGENLGKSDVVLDGLSDGI